MSVAIVPGEGWDRAIVPGEGWDRGNATDEDDNMEDPVAMMRKLPHNIQAGEATERIRMEHESGARRRRVLGEEESEDGLLDSQEDSQEDEPMEGEWGVDDPGYLGRLVQPYYAPAFTTEQKIRMEDCKTALQWYELFSPRSGSST